MKNNNLKKGIFTALLLVSSVVSAGEKYPAADFQPKVVFQDSEYKHSGATTSSAASFGEKAADDSNYPAATFKPEVLFQDTEYKHNTTVSNTPNTAKTASSNSEASSSADVTGTAEASEDADMTPLFGLIILAAAVFLYRKKAASKTAVNNYPEGPTGVAKYIQNKAPKISGVAKYLEANQPEPKSGVAKYVAKRVVEAKRAAAEKTTGVEKYMRNKG